MKARKLLIRALSLGPLAFALAVLVLKALKVAVAESTGDDVGTTDVRWVDIDV